jgi:hypothetical protein
MPFFMQPDLQQLLTRARTVLASAQPGFDEITAQKLAFVGQTLAIIQQNAQEFDERTGCNIGWAGNSLRTQLAELSLAPEGLQKLDSLLAVLYRFVLEFDFTMTGDVSFELGAFLRFVQAQSSSFTAEARAEVAYVERMMPISIMKRLLGSDILQNVPNVRAYSDKINAAFMDWDKKLDARQGRADALAEAIKKHETAFNFVGLYEGFNELWKQKRKELWAQRGAVVLLGVMALAPVLAELTLLAVNYDSIDKFKWPLTASAAPAISLTVILIYFFRLAVRAADSAKSQLLQIELRKTLCQFVQDYAEYAKKIREGSPDVLAKFEGVVFSGIVASDEKIPATFDGVEQLSNLIKAVRGAA